MIAIVDNFQICKKHLTGGVISELKPIFKGCFFQESKPSTESRGCYVNFQRGMDMPVSASVAPSDVDVATQLNLSVDD
jgi:hypothetical protein